MKELILSEELFLDSLKDAFKIRDHIFPFNENYMPATPRFIFSYQNDGTIEIIDTFINRD